MEAVSRVRTRVPLRPRLITNASKPLPVSVARYAVCSKVSISTEKPVNGLVLLCYKLLLLSVVCRAPDTSRVNVEER